MLEKLFESLDEKVFTAELKESLSTQFNEAVELKATILAEERIEEEIDTLSEKSDAHIEFLNTKAEEFVELKEAEMLDSVDKYLDRVVEEFVAEGKSALEESVKSDKADLIIEAFDSMLIATGVDVARIMESKSDSSAQKELDEAVIAKDSLVDELIALKEENEKLITMGVTQELKEGLSIVEAEKFEKLAKLVDFTRDESYAEKLELIKESVLGSKPAKSTKHVQMNEANSGKSADSDFTASFAHLI